MAYPKSWISTPRRIILILQIFALGIGFCLAQSSDHFSKNGIFTFANFFNKSNSILLKNDSLLAQVEVDIEEECQELCTKTPLCLSINYGEDPGNLGKIQCQMFRYGKTDYQNYLVPKTGFTHLRMKTVCSDNPCRGGITCNPILQNPARDHSCVCAGSDSTNAQNCDSGDIRCNALGMESRKILDSQITSSSDYSASYSKIYGRVNYGGSWIPSPITNSWIMIDLLKSTTILAVATQGRHDLPELIYTYEVHYRLNDADPFTAYQEDGVAKRLIANSNSVDVVKHELKVPFVAKAVRFLPKTWGGGNPGWRVELYGCYNS